jgi:hypothetical protein
MDKRIEVRCTDEQLTRWKVAAGEASLSSWVRFCCDSRVDAGEPLQREYRKAEVVAAFAAREFKPDFGSRLKEK